MSWIGEHDWLAWLGLAIALGAIEAATVTFVFLMLAGGALAGALAAAFGAGGALQVIVGVVVAAILLGVGRPIIRSQFTVPAGSHGIGTAAQIGRSALVLQTVTQNDGRIKLGGETWTARIVPDTAVCLPGQEVRIVAIEGATAIVTGVATGRKSE